MLGTSIGSRPQLIILRLTIKTPDSNTQKKKIVQPIRIKNQLMKGPAHPIPVELIQIAGTLGSDLCVPVITNTLMEILIMDVRSAFMIINAIQGEFDFMGNIHLKEFMCILILAFLNG